MRYLITSITLFVKLVMSYNFISFCALQSVFALSTIVPVLRIDDDRADRFEPQSSSFLTS